ncbi:hypothetical protein UlMin_009623 [Ulmus minor]
MGAFKAPGPDGMSALFYKHYWNIVSWDLVAAVREFFMTNLMEQSFNENFIVLIPKKPNPTRVNHFWPISVCNVAYRVVTKIIANRLKLLLNRLVCPTQNAFVPGRSIHDNSVLVQEAIHSMKKKKKRQGDPLSPYLFILCTEILSRLFMGKVESGMIHGFKLSRGGPSLHHLMFADDIFVFGKACITEASYIKETLDTFYSWSGLSFNSTKSSIFFNGNTRGAIANQLTDFLGFERIPMDSCYLGLPLFRTSKKNDFNFLVECLDTKLAGWKSRLLSKASRLTLIKSVALAMPIYAMHTARIPKENARPLCLKAWDDLCVPKAYYLCWLPASSGKFSARSFYLFVNNQRFAAASNIPKKIWLSIWNANILPHHKLLWWQIISNCLPTRTRLNRFFPGIDTQCPLCGQESKTLIHLLLFCDIVKIIWFSSPWNIRPDSLLVVAPADLISLLLQMEENLNCGNLLLFASILFDLV